MIPKTIALYSPVLGRPSPSQRRIQRPLYLYRDIVSIIARLRQPSIIARLRQPSIIARLQQPSIIGRLQQPSIIATYNKHRRLGLENKCPTPSPLLRSCTQTRYDRNGDPCPLTGVECRTLSMQVQVRRRQTLACSLPKASLESRLYTNGPMISTQACGLPSPRRNQLVQGVAMNRLEIRQSCASI